MVYNKHWYAGLHVLREYNEAALWAAFAHLGRPGSFLDLGCGDGWLVYTARTAGVPVSVGVEVSDDAQRYAPVGTQIIAHDLTQPLDLGRKFDMVWCTEVAEHLPEEAATELVRTLTWHTHKYLVFTAAIPGQGGFNHINCQPQEYWREMLEEFGLVYRKELTDQLRSTWAATTGWLIWLPQNLQVFELPPLTK